MLDDDLLHQRRLLVGRDAVGVGRSPEDVGEPGQVPRPVGRERLQLAHDPADRGSVLRRGDRAGNKLGLGIGLGRPAEEASKGHRLHLLDVVRRRESTRGRPDGSDDASAECG